ncbi:MAG: hypothetical protein FJ399_00660 [Verrucomicrobia bacterium]|nr:hypothetical protein [Verrucomicrobiota bacterium]
MKPTLHVLSDVFDDNACPPHRSLPPRAAAVGPTSAREGLLARAFRARYLRSLDSYRFFYDDLAALGDPHDAEHVFYFVPGLNGTPGQIRFILPSLTHVFGSHIFVKALHLPEFSARRPTWEKYTLANLDRKLARLRADLLALLARHERVTVITSSNGFYDFAAAAGSLPLEDLQERLHLVWGACAPDHFEPTPWERVFYPLNGFSHKGHRWFAYPNHNALRPFNPETSHTHFWRHGDQYRLFRKSDLESRFRFGGIEWDFVSPSQLGAAIRHVVRQIRGPLPLAAHALVATHDGYWQGKSPEVVERTIRKYLPDASILFRPASHLWVVTPTYVTELLRRVKLHSTGLSFPHPSPPPGRLGTGLAA